ncbi:MFS transporter [Evansella cellulosilytica]|uniref:Major facilitator superfamily MFS_1 n=1 Tax=Evansella cellulosilytica (strain ATCC 21833 / DSM 2522 / FERM P-1141 / JCM 9156 / N-4) TaxID=649639 RepID=E6U0C6_EVAC2|nr:MFS transporter [Evansella cellulosilytica]ADU30242.1 major facilitator superfamily MFS_1 [Evansella cellulosilytica DSM 2522]
MEKLTVWNPEDNKFWEEKGKRIANKNLKISVFALILAFCIWQLWSVTATRLNDVGFNFTNSELFTLAALPGLTGATLRLVYTFLPGLLGGKKTTILTTVVLLIPAIGIGFAVQNPETSFFTMALLAALCGLGGGNLASSTATINPFFPKQSKGTANGINVGIGNLGVSVVQFVTPIVIGLGFIGAITGGAQILPDGSEVYIQNAAFIWVVPIIVATILTIFFMDELPNTKQSVKSQLSVLKLKHFWIMAWLYIMCFGSFIGFAAAFPLLIRAEFPEINAVAFAFLGPLIGASLRPAGGWLSDKVNSGARVTFWTIIVMMLGTGGAIFFLNIQNFIGFLISFLLLFAGTGIANGSTFRMVPYIVEEKQAAPVMGLIAALAAYGAFFIPKIFGWSIESTGNANVALIIFICYYLVSLAVCWYWYTRKGCGQHC